MNPRWYQKESHDNFFDFVSSKKGNPIIAIPTGAGKSIIIAMIIWTLFNKFRGLRVGMFVHVEKLVKQNAEKLLSVWPHAPLGFYAAGMRLAQGDFPIVFGMIQSVFSALKKDIKALGILDVLIIDECHLVGGKESAAYLQVIAFFKSLNPNLVVLGLSATPWRLGLGELTEGGIFTDVIYDLCEYSAFNRLVDEGFLAPLVSKRTETSIDTSSYKIVAGEFQGRDIESGANEIIVPGVRETIHWGASENRRACLAFAASVQNSIDIADCFNMHGISATAVHSKLKPKECNDRMEDFEAGKYQVLVSMSKLTTGYDHPAVDLIADFAATNSSSRHVQKNGRGTRIFAGKRNCRVLDFAGNIARNGPINDPVMPRKPGEPTTGAPIKECPECGQFVHASVTICGGKNWNKDPEFPLGCGYEFPPHELNINSTSANESIMRRDDEPEFAWIPVTRVFYQPYKKNKEGAIPVLQVQYVCGTKNFREWVSPEHDKMKGLAQRWWQMRSHSVQNMPTTVQGWVDAAHMALRVPKAIHVHINKKPYPEVIDYEF